MNDSNPSSPGDDRRVSSAPRGERRAQNPPPPTSPTPSAGSPEPTWPQVDRRKGDRERRTPGDPSATGLERRRGPGRRLTDFLKAAEEGQLNQEQFLFLMAIEAFKRSNSVMYPTWTDVLEVVRLLGYRKTMPSELKINNAEDWREPADAPAKVRSKPGHPELDRRGEGSREAA